MMCNYLPMQNIFLTPILCFVNHWYTIYYKHYAEGQKTVRGTVWGLHFYKETDKIYKNALFLEFLAYLYFVVWLNSPELEVKSNLS